MQKEIVIKIDEEIYQSLTSENRINFQKLWELQIAIMNGTVLPENHGTLKDIGNFDVVALYRKSDEFIDGVMWILEQIDNAPTILEASESGQRN